MIFLPDVLDFIGSDKYFVGLLATDSREGSQPKGLTPAITGAQNGLCFHNIHPINKCKAYGSNVDLLSGVHSIPTMCVKFVQFH